MLALLRILFGFALFSVFAKATRLAADNPNTEGTVDGGYVAVAVGIGILNAIVWAPYIGALMADPLTGAFTTGNPADFTNRWLQFAHKLAVRGWRRGALFFAFCEGVRHPDLPGGFVLGLNHARPGSWLEKVFAREVWRFQNAENCLRAWKILKRRGVEPGLHLRTEVNLLIQSQQREIPAPTTVLELPPAPAAPAPKRNARIQLFKGTQGAGSGATPNAAPNADAMPASPLSANSEAAPPPELSAPDLAATRGRGPLSLANASTASSVDGVSPTDVHSPASPPETQPPLGWRDRLRVLFTGRSQS